jgi:hypothetical protein
MLEKTEQRFAGAAIGFVGVALGSLVVGIVLLINRPLIGGGGGKDTPIVMEGGSIILSSDTPWTCTPLDVTPTVCTTTLLRAGSPPVAQSVRRIRVVQLDEVHDILVAKAIKSTDTWTVTVTTSASEPEVVSGTGNTITVTTSASAKTQLSDGSGGANFKELTIFPFDNGNYTNTIRQIGITVNNVPVGSPQSCTSGTEVGRCFVHFKVVDQ